MVNTAYCSITTGIFFPRFINVFTGLFALTHIGGIIIFKGNWATLIIPWNKDGTIDIVALEEEIHIVIDAHVDGIYSCGTAGEFHVLTKDEFLTVNSKLSEICNKLQCSFQIGASNTNPNVCLENITDILYLEPKGIQLIAPDWWPASLEVAIEFLKEAECVTKGNIPLVLYNPPHAKRIYTIEEIAAIKQDVNALKGIKVLDGDALWYEKMRNLLNTKDISVFVPGHHMATGMKNGANGSYSNVCCINPKMAQQWTNLIVNKEWDMAFDIERRIILFMEKIIVPFINEGVPNYLLDRAMAVAGDWGPLRVHSKWPYKGLSLDDCIQIRMKGRKIIPEFFNQGEI